jgi:hypothetical protein
MKTKKKKKTYNRTKNAIITAPLVAPVMLI